MPEANETPAENTPAAPEAAATPPWGSAEEFDPEKAWKLIQNLKADKEKLSGREVMTDDAKAKLAEYDRLVEASKTDLERKTEELSRWQEDAQRWRSTAVGARIQALASADFADPTDAVGSLDAAKYLTAGGEIDEDAIKADLASVLERKPHWRRSPDGPPAPRVPAPNPAQGAAGGATPAAAAPRDQFAAFLQAQLRAQ